MKQRKETKIEQADFRFILSTNLEVKGIFLTCERK